jgi:hypothetical protein
MTITWYGHFCLKLSTSATKPVNLIINPYGDYKELGLANVLLQRPDILVNGNAVKSVNADFVIDSPGEYNIKGIDLFCSKEEGQEIYFINIDNLKCLFLGEISQSEISPKVLPFLPKQIDILFVPVGGDFNLLGKKHKMISPEEALKIVKKINPKVIIPIHYKTPNLKLKIEDASQFMKLLGKKAEPQEKINLKERDLVDKERELILLRP